MYDEIVAEARKHALEFLGRQPDEYNSLAPEDLTRSSRPDYWIVLLSYQLPNDPTKLYLTVVLRGAVVTVTPGGV